MWGRVRVAGLVAAVVVVVSAVVVAGCGGWSISGSAVVPAGVSSSSSSLGLSEDDPLNTDSTKDLSLVTATIDSNSNPYQFLLPNMCTRIPISAWVAAGADLQRMPPKDSLGPTNTLLRSCRSGVVNSVTVLAAISATIYPFPASEFFQDANKQVLKSDISVGPHVATMFQQIDDAGNNCDVAYPTFFGMADFAAVKPADVQGFDVCGQALRTAQVMYPFVPTRPSEMRRTP